MASVMRVSPRLKMKLPLVSDEWHERGYAVLLDGSIARLESSFDINRALLDRRESAMAGKTSTGPWPPYPDDAKQRFALFGADSVSVSGEFDVGEIFAQFDRISDGTWIIADSRCGVVDSNARIVDWSGEISFRLLVGDGIEQLQCDASGRIWAGYFDEGIFGNNGWGAPDGPTPIGATGINCFEKTGAISWPDRNELGKAEWPLPFIADCYTLNVTQEAVWICPYTDFPIVRISSDRSIRTWSNEKSGADILAIEDDLAVLVGGYTEERRHGVLLDLRGDIARRIADFEIDIDIDDLRKLPLASGRGSTIHFVVNDRWYQLTVKDIANEIA